MSVTVNPIGPEVGIEISGRAGHQLADPVVAAQTW
jgi:hypothetical protein